MDSNQHPLFIRAIKIDWEKIGACSYLRKIPALNALDTLPLSNPVTFFSGENGSGKSTLLEGIAIAAGFNPEGGTKNYAFSTFDSHSELCQAIKLIRGSKREQWGYFLRAESFYNVASMEDEYARGPNGHPMKYHERSHGESFMALIHHQFHGAGLYILDEPEAALSPQRQLSLLIEINEGVKRGAQFIIATQSPILLGFPNGAILSFDGGQIHPCVYEETESYKVTEMFINDRQRVLSRLF